MYLFSLNIFSANWSLKLCINRNCMEFLYDFLGVVGELYV